MRIKKIIIDIFTERDNKTFDISKFLAFLSIMSAIIMTIHQYFNKGVFDIEKYGMGIGVLFGGLALALGLKKDSGFDSDGNKLEPLNKINTKRINNNVDYNNNNDKKYDDIPKP